jgi:hypothetical protein
MILTVSSSAEPVLVFEARLVDGYPFRGAHRDGVTVAVVSSGRTPVCRI